MHCRSDVEGFGTVYILVYWVHQDLDAGGAGEQGRGNRQGNRGGMKIT
jgi:hypothetical protein